MSGTFSLSAIELFQWHSNLPACFADRISSSPIILLSNPNLNYFNLDGVCALRKRKDRPLKGKFFPLASGGHGIKYHGHT